MQSVLDIIDKALRERGISARRASLEATGTPDLIREMRRGRAPSAERLRALCAVLGLEFYVGPPREKKAAKTQEADAIEDALRRELSPAVSKLDEVLARLPDKAEAHDPAATRHVEVRELAAAAGGGAEADVERVVGRIAFRRDWLDRQGLDPNQCTVIGVQGESMEPTLPEGCAILVNRARRRRHVGGIFVVRTGEGLIVKRAGKDKSGGWLLLSDHPAWKPAPWPADAVVIGEVKWMARTL